MVRIWSTVVAPKQRLKYCPLCCLMLWCVSHGTRGSLGLAAGYQARMALDVLSYVLPVTPWCTLLGVLPMVLSDRPPTLSPLTHTLLPFSPQ